MKRPALSVVRLFAPALILTAAPLLRAEVAIHEVRSPHYRLHWEGSEKEAHEISRVLEGAWAGFERFFKARPRLKKGEGLTVRVFRTRAKWKKAIEDDGTAAPASGGGYYWISFIT
jgi:hypothetical protein